MPILAPPLTTGERRSIWRDLNGALQSQSGLKQARARDPSGSRPDGEQKESGRAIAGRIGQSPDGSGAMLRQERADFRPHRGGAGEPSISTWGIAVLANTLLLDGGPIKSLAAVHFPPMGVSPHGPVYAERNAQVSRTRQRVFECGAGDHARVVGGIDQRVPRPWLRGPIRRRGMPSARAARSAGRNPAVPLPSQQLAGSACSQGRTMLPSRSRRAATISRDKLLSIPARAASSASRSRALSPASCSQRSASRHSRIAARSAMTLGWVCSQRTKRAVSGESCHSSP